MRPAPTLRPPAARRLVAWLCAVLALLGLPAAALAQPLPSPYTSASRFDASGRLIGTIDADPGTGTPVYAAVRYSYNGAGRLVRMEKGWLSAWQAQSVAPAAWSGFTILQTVETSHDGAGRKLKDELWANGVRETVTQYSYDAAGRPECTAVRMDRTAFGSLPASACDLGQTGTAGPDRITRNIHDSAGQLSTVQRAYGVTMANGFPATLQQDYARYEYTPNGKRKAVIDANGNRAEMTWDSYDRQESWIFPTASGTAGTANPADYEEYGYDPNGNRTTLRKRDGVVLSFAYDALNRLTQKTVPASMTGAPGYSVFYGFDLRGLQTYARFGSASGPGVSNAYDGFGQISASTTDMDGTPRTLAPLYDRNGNRTGFAPAAGSFGYVPGFVYDRLDRMTASTGPSGPIITISYDAAGRRSALGTGLPAQPPSASTIYGFDSAGRLQTLGHDLAGTSADQVLGFTYNPAAQILTRSSANPAYASNTAYNVTRPYSVNGLNQYTAAGAATFVYDANGNLVSDGSTSFVYDSENRLVSASGARTASLAYDPLGRLWQTSGGASGTTRFFYDGDRLIVEYDQFGSPRRVYGHGPGPDEPLFWYEFSDGSRRFLKADHQGSIVAVADSSGTPRAINAYDSWGIPNPGNQGRFGYTGQTWIPELGMWHYKARIYSPTLGRFLQTDPVGYEDQVDLYAYVGNDPLNHTDPTGTVGLVINAGRVGYKGYKYRNAGGFVRGINEVGRSVGRDWRALDDRARTSVGNKLRAFSDLVLGTELYNGPFNVKGEGKIEGNADPSSVGNAELEDGIAQLEKSIKLRTEENASFPKGNPNSPDPRQRQNYKDYQGHKEKVLREQRVLEELRERLRKRDPY